MSNNLGSIIGKSIVIEDGASINIDGAFFSIGSGNTCSSITINGVQKELPKKPHVHLTGTQFEVVQLGSGNLTINGDVKEVRVTNGNVTVHGDVASARVTNGNVVRK